VIKHLWSVSAVLTKIAGLTLYARCEYSGIFSVDLNPLSNF
jgi:hypothetical protein